MHNTLITDRSDSRHPKLENQLKPNPSQASVPQILAPAGGPEQFLAALYSGADAVYLGLQRFNARARAGNFDPEQLRSHINLARAYDMKVLVTLNILIKDIEIPALIDTLATLAELEVDAIIVQDLGVAALARACFPHLRLHASTQLAVHNKEGVRAAARLGFKRVVVARELTAIEIRSLAFEGQQWGVETEAFCHGSLCYAYSGLCFFSGAEDARSGNRGECAYTCRKPYRIVSEEGQGYLFSMKDLNTLHSLQTLVDTGVHTLKIEGRKKDAQYVATTVRAYRAQLDQMAGHSTLRVSAPPQAHRAPEDTAEISEVMKQIERDLGLTFSRANTSLFLMGRYKENVIDLENPTHRGTPVGVIAAVERQCVAIKATAEALRLFDGIRIESAHDIAHGARYHNELCAFSLRGLWDNQGHSVFSAPTGSSVSIALPDGSEQQVQVGDRVFKTRCASLKENIEKISRPASNDRLRPLRLVETSIHADASEDGTFILEVKVSKCGSLLAAARERITQTRPHSGPSTLTEDLCAAFRIYGDEGFASPELNLIGDFSWFFPRGLIKILKRKIAGALPGAYAQWIADNRMVAHNWIGQLPRQEDLSCVPRPLEAPGTPMPDTAAPPIAFLQIKSDRIDVLSAACAVQKSGISVSGGYQWKLAELTFEPKRHLYPHLKPNGLIDGVCRLAEDAGLPLRIAVPTVMRAWDMPVFRKLLQAAHDAGLRAFEIPGIGALEMLRSEGFDPDELDLTTDFTAFGLNRLASREWAQLGARRITLSVEDDFKNLRSHLQNWCAPAQPEVILYKDTPLFIAESCTLTALHKGCPTSAVCGYRSLEIEDESGERYHVAHESCKSVVYGQRPYSISNQVAQLIGQGVRHFRIDFLTREYKPDQINTIIQKCAEGALIEGTHPANFHRTLL
jgi:putative protease